MRITNSKVSPQLQFFLDIVSPRPISRQAHATSVPIGDPKNAMPSLVATTS